MLPARSGIDNSLRAAGLAEAPDNVAAARAWCQVRIRKVGRGASTTDALDPLDSGIVGTTSISHPWIFTPRAAHPRDIDLERT